MAKRASQHKVHAGDKETTDTAPAEPKSSLSPVAAFEALLETLVSNGARTPALAASSLVPPLAAPPVKHHFAVLHVLPIFASSSLRRQLQAVPSMRWRN